MAGFMERMEEMDRLVVDKLREVHQKRAKSINARRREPASFRVGAKVWYQPERQPGTDKLEPRWKGPALVLEHEGQFSYVVQLRPGVVQKAHRSQLKPHVEDEYHGKSVPLFYFSGRAPELEAAVDEWKTRTVLDHRRGNKGEMEFLVQWEDAEGEQPTRQPWSDFAVAVNSDFLQYCADKHLSLDLAALAA